MNMTAEPVSRPGFFGRHGTVLKMMAISVLVVFLLIPLAMIGSVIRERQGREAGVVREISSAWGEAQTINGPVLMVPYNYQVRDYREEIVNGHTNRVPEVRIRTAQAYFLPANLKISGKLDPKILHRGIYQAVVYGGTLSISGSFKKPVFDEWGVRPEDIIWKDSTVSFMITDLRGMKDVISLKWGDRSVPLASGSKLREFPSGLHARLGDSPFDKESVDFDLPVTLNGSRCIDFVPVGGKTEVSLSSSWPDPSFYGSFLPADRKVSAGGFEASWQMSCYGRSYPQQWSMAGGGSPFNSETVRASQFGVSLIFAVDSYRYVERSIKYGVLFIVLVFTAFFLFEVLSRLKIHPFQYTLVGVAMCMFYLGLLSLSEITDFGLAYLAGAVLSAGLVTFYSGYVLRSFRRAMVVAGGLATIYGLLYVILRQQDYSLLLGTAGLFIVLAIVMYVTRHIDWYARDGYSE
jgi:inner membrane protein